MPPTDALRPATVAFNRTAGLAENGVHTRKPK